MAARGGEFKLFTWGANTHGQLCNGTTEDESIPQQVLGAEGNLNLSRVSQIHGGGGFIEFLTDDGNLYACGQNHRGQLGIGHSNNVNILTKNGICEHIDGKIIKITCGWEHTLCLTGTLYGWGSNTHSQLRSLDDVTFVNYPFKLEYNPGITDIAAGLRHSLALTVDGTVLSWGNGRKGQLGFGEEFVFCPDDDKIKRVVCGANHSAALSENGNVYLCGDNSNGQLGQDPSVLKASNVPVLIDSQFFGGETIEQLYSGWSHLIAITKESKSVYAWGRNDYGQLGTQSTLPWLPIKLDIRFKSISAGSEHNLGVTLESQLLSWGWNEHGVCGTGSTSNCLMKPTLINSLKDYHIHCIGTNCGSCYAIVY